MGQALNTYYFLPYQWAFILLNVVDIEMDWVVIYALKFHKVGKSGDLCFTENLNMP